MSFSLQIFNFGWLDSESLFVSQNKLLLLTIFHSPPRKVCVPESEKVGMSQHFLQYTVEALSTIPQGSVVCFTLTVTSSGRLVSEQMFGRQVQSKLFSDPAAVCCGFKNGWLVI